MLPRQVERKVRTASVFWMEIQSGLWEHCPVMWEKERTFKFILRVLTFNCMSLRNPSSAKADGFVMLSMGEHQLLIGAKSGYGVVFLWLYLTDCFSWIRPS